MLASYTWLTTLQTYAVRNLATGLLVIGLGLVFYFIPNAKTRFRDVWVGAVLTGLLWSTRVSGVRLVHQGECRPEDDSRVGGRGDCVPPLGLRVVDHPDVRRRVHSRLRAAAAPAARRDARCAIAPRMRVSGLAVFGPRCGGDARHPWSIRVCSSHHARLRGAGNRRWETGQRTVPEGDARSSPTRQRFDTSAPSHDDSHVSRPGRSIHKRRDCRYARDQRGGAARRSDLDSSRCARAGDE